MEAQLQKFIHKKCCGTIKIFYIYDTSVELFLREEGGGSSGLEKQHFQNLQIA